jgi:uncharacterized protein
VHDGSNSMTVNRRARSQRAGNDRDRETTARNAPRFIEIKVRPNAGASALHEEAPGVFSADLKSPPIDGKANAELIALVARHFGCKRAAVTIRTGGSARVKLVRIASS